jgi:hypothetical protein
MAWTAWWRRVAVGCRSLSLKYISYLGLFTMSSLITQPTGIFLAVSDIGSRVDYPSSFPISNEI